VKKARVRNNSYWQFINLKVERIRRNITAEELATMAGITRTWLWRIETGLKKPNDKLKQFYSEFFNKPVEYLFEFCKEKEIKRDEQYCKYCGRKYEGKEELPFSD
jgi:transcriptional regulator with XRE-family HTH domain